MLRIVFQVAYKCLILIEKKDHQSAFIEDDKNSYKNAEILRMLNYKQHTPATIKPSKFCSSSRLFLTIL